MTISVILCTYNPDARLLAWALDSLAGQTHRDFELVVVDNNSTPPLDEDSLQRERSLNLRVVREPRQGLTHARCAGIEATSGNLIVFVDDDNHLDPDYLRQALEIAQSDTAIGHFGGISIAELGAPVPEWKRRLLPYLGVRDHGSAPITSSEPRWGAWEPIGAGMVTRRAVAMEFVRMVRSNSLALLLGRQGTSLMSGEDTLRARAANALGYACSYQPSLKLRHYIKPARLSPRVLSRTLEGHGRSYVVLERVLGRDVERPSLHWMARELVLRLLYRIRREGVAAGGVSWCWDIGFMRQARRSE